MDFESLFIYRPAWVLISVYSNNMQIPTVLLRLQLINAPSCQLLSPFKTWETNDSWWCFPTVGLPPVPDFLGCPKLCHAVPRPSKTSPGTPNVPDFNVKVWSWVNACSLLCSNNTHTRLMALCPGLPGWASTKKRKTNLDFTEARDSEWQWHQLGHMQVCTSLQTDTTPAPHRSVFYRPDALPAAQPTASKHWRQYAAITLQYNHEDIVIGRLVQFLLPSYKCTGSAAYK